MRALLLTLALAAPLQAAPPTYGIQLDGLVVKGSTATGRCGPASVRIAGIAPEVSGKEVVFDPGAIIDITSGAKRLRAAQSSDDAITLDSRADVWCLTTKAGPRLVIGVHCSAVHCLPVDYKVIDTVAMQLLGDGDECDAKCAQRLVGAPLPRMRP